jgi:type I site-specific restriction endonuclease
MDEAQTCRELIDKNLKLAGWDTRDPSQGTQELDIDLTLAGASRVAERSGSSARPFASGPTTRWPPRTWIGS